jgi:hypothetical protein
VIRRGLWLTVGAALGVTGYRRITRIADGLRPASMRHPGHAGRRRGRQRTLGQFVRDVRDGMDEYLDQHPRGWSPTLEGQQARPRAALDRAGSRTHSGTHDPKDGS